MSIPSKKSSLNSSRKEVSRFSAVTCDYRRRKKMNGCPKMSELIRASWWRASISHDFRWKGDEYSMKPDDVCDDASLASCWCSRSSAAWWTTGDRQLNQTGMGSLLVVGLSLLDSITHPTQPPFPPPSSLNALIAFQNRISIRGTHR